MTEPKRRKVKAEEEGVGRVWESGVWRDILPTVFHLLPPRERFVVQRVSRLFERTSEEARLAVGQLELGATKQRDNTTKDFKFTAKILDPNASDGITSLRLPHVWDSVNPLLLGILLEHESESLLKNRQRKCQKALAKLNLPTLSHVSLCTGPFTRSLRPFLRSHPSISSVELRIMKNCCTLDSLNDKHFKGLKIRQLTIRFECFSGDSDHFKDWTTNLLDNVEELSLYGVDLYNLNFLPDPFKLTSLHYDQKNLCRVFWPSFLTEAPGLRRLTLTNWSPSDTVYGLGLEGFPLESLHLDCLITGNNVYVAVKAIIKSFLSDGGASKLTQSLQELTVSVRHCPKMFDMRPECFSMFNTIGTSAILHFPRLHSLRLRIETSRDWKAPFPVRDPVSYEALPAVAELNRRLRVLEIPVLLPEPEGTSRNEILKELQRKLVPFLENASSVEGGAMERKFTWLPVFRTTEGELLFDPVIRPMAVEYTRRQDKGWTVKNV